MRSVPIKADPIRLARPARAAKSELSKLGRRYFGHRSVSVCVLRSSQPKTVWPKVLAKDCLERERERRAQLCALVVRLCLRSAQAHSHTCAHEPARVPNLSCGARAAERSAHTQLAHSHTKRSPAPTCWPAEKPLTGTFALGAQHRARQHHWQARRPVMLISYETPLETSSPPPPANGHSAASRHHCALARSLDKAPSGQVSGSPSIDQSSGCIHRSVGQRASKLAQGSAARLLNLNSASTEQLHSGWPPLSVRLEGRQLGAPSAVCARDLRSPKTSSKRKTSRKAA